MRHFLPGEMDAFLDGRRNSFWRWRAARHIARCPECQRLQKTCEADRALLDEIRGATREHEAVARALPATRVVAPSFSHKQKV